MILDKLKPFWTEEEARRQAEIQQEADSILASVYDAHTHGESATEEQAKRLQELTTEEQAIREAVHERYIKGRSAKQLVADAKEIIEAIDQADFKKFIADQRSYRATLRAEGTPEDELAILNPFSVESFENCYSYIDLYVALQKAALELMGDTASVDKVRAYIRKRAALWYEEKQPTFLKMAHGKATDALAYMNTKNAAIDRVTGNATIDKMGVTLTILKLRDLQATLGISADKLLSTAIAAFTRQNDFRQKGKEPDGQVTIPLKWYAGLLGYDVEEHPTSTPEEAAREKKRAKMQLDNARKAIKKDLLLLQASTLRWQESINGKPRDFDSISLVYRVSIRNGEINVFFSPAITSYLAECNRLTQYPTKLLGLDNRNTTAYYIARKLAEHYNMDPNQKRGTNDRLSIPAILAVTDLPSYEEVQKKDRGHWAERIKEPFERALDTLKQEGILADWEYIHAKGVDLTEEEAYNITSYDTFSGLYLRFTMAEEVDHKERIARKEEARAKAQKRKKATKKKS